VRFDEINLIGVCLALMAMLATVVFSLRRQRARVGLRDAH